MKLNSNFFLSILLIICASCGVSKTQTTPNANNTDSANAPSRPVEIYTAPLEVAPKTSLVNIPIRFKSSDIENLLNAKLNYVIYEDNNADDDGLMMKATKNQNITLKLDGLNIDYVVPLKLWVWRKILDNAWTGKRGIEAEGDITLNFRTTLNIYGDWTVDSRTELTNYSWQHNMAVKTGIGNIDVKYLADIIIGKTKNVITQGIDKQLKSQFQLFAPMNEAWKQMQNPISMTNAYGRWWVKLTPQDVTLTPFRNENDALATNVFISTLVDVKTGDNQPAFRPNSFLPPFQYAYTTADSFNINLVTSIPLVEAERMAQNYCANQTFNAGGKKIRISKIELFGQNEKMIVNTKFEGDFSGNLYLVGKPVFNSLTNSVELQDLDYDLQTKSFMIRTAKWLFDRTILKKIKESCVFKVDNNITTLKNTLNDQMRNYRFSNNVSINGFVTDIFINNIQLQQNEIKVFISSVGKINVELSNLSNY